MSIWVFELVTLKWNGHFPILLFYGNLLFHILNIRNNFLDVIKQQTTVTDKVKHRLEELDDLEEVQFLSIGC